MGERLMRPEDAIELHRTRWQILVNAVADAFNDGLVPGNDRQAIKWAKDTIEAAGRKLRNDRTD